MLNENLQYKQINDIKFVFTYLINEYLSFELMDSIQKDESNE